jgi:polar amino acid transport system substrate-binding protein
MRFATALLSTTVALGGASLAQPTPPASPMALTLHYQERPPYYATRADGSVGGLVADPAADALRRAGIAVQWALTPSQRQLALVQSGAGLQCGLGWFRNPERETRGRFSAPLYQDQPLVALARNEALQARTTSAAALLQSGSLRLLVKDGYSYGAWLDGLIAQAARPPLRTTVEPLQMSRMLRSGRADWMIVAPEEAQVLEREGLHLTRLTDAPDGPTRHLYCSSDVPATWMARIDDALRGRRR